MSYQLTEKIYYSKDDNISFLDSFMNDFIKRAKQCKRDDFNGVIAILEDKAGAKVCDNDGENHHYHSHMNVVHFLNGGTNFYTPEEATLNSSICSAENNELMNHGVEIRFVSRTKNFEVTIMAIATVLNEYQKKCLNKIIDLTKEVRDECLYPKVNIGIFYGAKDDYGVLTDERIDNIRQIIESGRRR